MRREILGLGLLGALVACESGDQTNPTQYSPPSYLISDATHSSGNPDFFWLPPMVKDPSKSSFFDVGKFNPDLLPVVTVCPLPGTQESSIGSGTACSSPPVALPAPVVNTTSEFYQTSWTVPVSSTVFYRLQALVGSKVLGIADVHTVPSPSQLKSVGSNFVGQQDGSNLPIKFRIERAALCTPPGVYPCNSSNVDLEVGKDVVTDTPDGNGGSGVHLPGQDNLTGKPVITVDNCDDLNPRAIDLPTFGSCIRITADPPITSPLDVPATVFVCDVGPDLPAGMPEDQEKRITLHQLDVVGGQNVVHALPHAAGCPQVGAQATVKGFINALAHKNWRKAGKELAGLLSPRPLYARRIDQGGGGEQVSDFSDFQFALPVKGQISAGQNQGVVAGNAAATNPTVLVTDLGNLPVSGVTVKFTPQASGTVNAGLASVSVVTGLDGTAQVSWKPEAAFGTTKTLTASGRGMGGDDFNGPRTGLDPFQACPYGGPLPTPDSCPGGNSGAVEVKTGSLIFNAYGAEGFETAGSWAVSGFWHRSQLGSSIINKAYTDGLVGLAPGDASGGAMPNPFAGAWSAWYGTQPGASPPVGTENGNYMGDRSGNNAINSGSGGESLAANSGNLTSPDFVVPASGILHFQGWFEIESVDANAYDLMSVAFQEGANAPVPLGNLNPTVDVNGAFTQPFTSAGFNAIPIWKEYTADLSALAGHTGHLIFGFNTIDNKYNGYRGLIVDNIFVAPNPPSSFRAALLNAGGGLNPPSPPGPRRP